MDRAVTLRPGDLVYQPHGGARLGKVVCIVDHVAPDGFTHVRRWHPGDRCFGRAQAVRTDTISEFVPQTDRRVAGIRRYQRATA